MNTRSQKQIIYGVGFLVVLALAVWGSLALFGAGRSPAKETPSPTPAVSPVQVAEVSTIQHAAAPGFGHTVDVVVRLRNPNLRAGAAQFPLKLTLRGARGQVLESQTIKPYILPGAVTYAVKLAVPVLEGVSSVDVELPKDPKFFTVPVSVSLPSFSVTFRDRTVRNEGNTVMEEQKGIVTNTSRLDWQLVEVIGVAIGESGKVVGVGQTSVGELKVGEQREFTLSWPATREAVRRVIPVATTNIYRQENIVRAIGDPSLLR